MKQYQIKTTKLSSRERKENEQFIYLNKKYRDVDVDIEFLEIRNALDKIELEPDGDIREASILPLVPQAKQGDCIHLRISDRDWKKLGLRKTLFGQHRLIKGVTITYGRWTDFNDRRARLFTKEFGGRIYSHVLGMFHEYFHSLDGKQAITHSFLYGYDKIYSKTDETKLKPERNYDNASLMKLIEYHKEKKAEIIQPKKKDDTFEKAVSLILKHEGGYVNHFSDPGGETKYGISKRSYPKLDIKNLTVEQAKDIYYHDFWLKAKCDKMKYSVAIQVFDMAVNAGVSRAIKILQKVLGVTQDGIIGPVTLGAVAKMTEGMFIDYFAERQYYYQSLKTFSTFGKGWTRRNIETLKESLT